MIPKLTVLMPVYNAQKFLRQAIDSILNQTLKEFEFLIIDDASTDNSVSIIRSYNDPRIRLIINEQNSGISATLNKGIDLASCDLIARMDADDISYPERLEKQYIHYLNHPDVALISCWARVINEAGEFIRLEKYETPYYYYNLNFECWIYHPTVVYNRNAVSSIGKYTETYSEDFELFWQLSRKFKIDNIEEVLVDYRITAASLHQVTRKTEYEQAQEKQVLRNIAFFMGFNFQLSANEVECLRHNFRPMLEANRVQELIKCLSKLKKIAVAIYNTENVNRHEKSLKEAIWYKQNFIVDFFARNLPEHKAVLLLLRLREWKRLKRLSIDYIKRKTNN